LFHMNTKSGTLDGELLDYYEINFVRYTVVHSESYHGEGRITRLRDFFGRLQARLSRKNQLLGPLNQRIAAHQKPCRA
jgi:antitoxin component YwqK of YwqJK toxin-antitoxin module